MTASPLPASQAVVRRAPFTIRLRDRERTDSQVDGPQLRIDPGSKITGFALTQDTHKTAQDGAGTVVRRGLIAVELHHRGARIRAGLVQRAAYRRRRRVANCPACIPCNQAKGSLPVEVFLAHDPERLAEILKQLKVPLVDAAAMNSTGKQLMAALDLLGKPIRAWSGSRGRGSYARTTPDRFGFPACIARARSSSTASSAATWCAPRSRGAGGRASGRGPSRSAFADSIGSRRQRAASTSRTSI